MIRYEKTEFVNEILENGSCIAVPVEISYTADGTLDLLVYPFCAKITEDFEKKYASDPFSAEAAAFLYDKLTPVMAELGYSTAGASEHAYFDYRCTSPDTSKILPGCEIIGTLAGEKWDELELDEFILDPADPTDRMAVIRENGKIVCYAGLNDLSEEDGLFELTVECGEKYRRRGYAASCVAKLTEYLTGIGEGVKYICAQTHVISQKTAESAGFTLYRKVLPFVCMKTDDEDSDTDETYDNNEVNINGV